MPETSFFQLWNKLDAGEDPPAVLLLFGFNEFLGEVIIQNVRLAFLKRKTECDYRRYYFDEEGGSWEEILNEIKSRGFFFEAQKTFIAVIRRESELAIDDPKKSLAKESLIQYLGNPNPRACLIVFVSMDIMRDDYKQLRKTRLEKFLKLFQTGKAVWVDLDKVGESDIKNMIKKQLKEKKITITGSAIERMLEIKGDDFISVIQQLPKLEMAGARSKSLDSEDVDEIITGVNSHSIWDLTEAIEKEDTPTYLSILKYLFINGIKPSFIIGTLITHYHRIYTAQFLLKHHFSVQDIGKVLQQQPFFLNKFIQMVRNFSEYKINEILKLIYKLDLESKTGGEDGARVSLQNFIFQVKLLKNA